MSILTVSLLIAGVHLAVPIVLPLLGGLISERSGVMNIGLEGMMLVGALSAVVATWATGDPWVGVLGAAVAGLLAGAVLALLTVTLRADQVVASTAVNLVGAGLTAALVPIIWGSDGTSPSVVKVPALVLPGLSDLPGVGQLFRELTLVDYGTGLLVVAVWWVLFRTDVGLRLRACGESAESADAAGIDVVRTRWTAVALSGVFAALGGAYLSIVVLDAFQAGMTQGRGYLALAALVFGAWRVWPAVAACLVFGLADALALRSQIVAPQIPHDLLLAMPYLLALVALATFAGKGSAPASIGKRFARA